MDKKEIGFFMIFMVVFFIVFIVAMINFIQGKAIFNIGLSPIIINSLVLALSFFGIIKAVLHISIS